MAATVRTYHRKAVLSVVLTLCLILATLLPAFAATGISNEQLKAATSIARQMEDEGIVLLKNTGDFLPLKNKKVNVFGIASCDLLLSGGGSGSVTASESVNFYEGLKHGGIRYNKDLKTVYQNWKSSHSLPETGNGLIDMLLGYVQGDGVDEMPIENIPQEQMDSARAYSDTALIVFGSAGTELSDLSKKDLRLNETQRAMLDAVTSNFENVIVVFNTSNTMEMDWVEQYDNIRAALLMWLPGQVGAESLGDVLSGKVNPSGKLTDTIAWSLSDYPTNRNFGNYQYDGTLPSILGKYFVDYEEGIYLGYRYFETFAPDKVQYPFGYGLSYTTFDWKVTGFRANANTVTVNVKVTNTGKRAGKDVVQVYFSAPYTKGGIEKSKIELAAYGKTGLLQPGKSQTLTLTYKTDDMASYDADGKEAWVLDKGTYKIKVAHSVRDIEKTYSYTVPKTKVIKNDDKTGTKIQNLFDDTDEGLTVLSRADRKGTFPKKPTDFSMPESVANADQRPTTAVKGEAPKQGVTYEDGTILLADVAKDDSLWEKFLDQLTVDEMIEMVSKSGYGTMGIKRLGVPATADNDGPAAVKGPGGLLYTKIGFAYPVEATLACTWNDALAETFDRSVGREARQVGTHVWYAPGCNLRRSPLGGRNFEYFSEDPYLSGKMSAAVTRGAQSQGIVVTLKHFVCNEQETNRQANGLFTWVNEQALRELYLEPFELGVKEGDAHGVMSAYNRIGATWCGASRPLLVDLLRDEWGFEGYVVTDAYTNWTGSGYLDPVLAVYARNDGVLTSFWYFTQEIQTSTALRSQYAKDPVGFGQALRDCVYDLCVMKLYTTALQTMGQDTSLPNADVLLSADDAIDYEPSATDQILVTLSELLASHDG